MGWIELTAADGHRLRAWQSVPAQPPRGALVVLQEIFGVNPHIRDLCDRYAEAGWLAVGPSLFDRVGGPAEGLGYSAEDQTTGRDLKARVAQDHALLDVAAAVAHGRAMGLRVAVIGFCWGGTLAWLAAGGIGNVSAAVAYYGTAIAANVGVKPSVPVLLHFGEQDTHIPPEDVALIARLHPDIELHRYPAGHGFNCAARAAYHPESAALAGQRTAAFLSTLTRQ